MMAPIMNVLLNSVEACVSHTQSLTQSLRRHKNLRKESYYFTALTKPLGERGMYKAGRATVAAMWAALNRNKGTSLDGPAEAEVARRLEHYY